MFRVFRKRNLIIVTFIIGLMLTFVSTTIASANYQNYFLEGYNHGATFQGNIKTTIDNFLAGLDSQEYSIDELRAKANEIENLYMEIIPEKIEWMKGVADSTLIDYNDILLFNCFDKLTSTTAECTSFMAQGKATEEGVTIIAKNRDLGADSINCVELQEHRYPGESSYQAAYIDISQVEETYKFVGTKSVGRWGFGQGINEFQVSIIDNDAGSMDELSYTKGLHDNDYIRLALERSKTAREAVDVIGELTEKYSQAWNGIDFTIGDPNEVWLMEVTGYNWVAKKYTDTVMAIANQFQLTDNYDLASKNLVSYALEQGWIDKEVPKINFREVYGAKDLYPGPDDKKAQKWPIYTSQIRQERAMELLNGKIGELTERDMISFLQDHYDKVKLENGTEVDMHQTPYYSSDFEKIGQPFIRAICHHGITGKTCSSSVMVSRPGIPNELGIMWASLGQPCQSIYVPFYVGVNSIAEGFTNAKDVSKFYLIRDFAFGEYKKYQSVIRRVFDSGQKANYFLEPLVRQKAIEDFEAGDATVAKQELTDFCYERAMEALHEADVVLGEMTEATVKAQSW
jgi:dipeptidase